MNVILRQQRDNPSPDIDQVNAALVRAAGGLGDVGQYDLQRQA